MAAAGKLEGKPPLTAEEQLLVERERRIVATIAPSAFFTILAGTVLFSARQALLEPLLKDTAAQTLFSTRMSSMGALAEFIANPIVGKLADAYGRRPILPLCGAVMAVVRLLPFFQPNRKWPLVLESLILTPVLTAYITVYRAALADRLEGTAFARANATISMAIGGSLILGPLVSKAVMKVGGPKDCFLASSFFALFSCAHLLRGFEETLPVEKRTCLKLSDMQPFSFLAIFKDSVLRRLMLVVGWQTCTEGRNITELIAVHLRNELEWSWDQINNFVASYGFSLIASGFAVKSMLQVLGLHRFTTFSNVTNTLNLLCYAQAPPLPALMSSVQLMYLSLFFAAPGGRKRDAVEALLMRLGSKRGFGNGFISGSMMNFRAIVNILAPLLLGSLYAWGAKRGKATIAFYVSALTVVAAELTFQTLRHEELELDEHGQIVQEEAKPTAAS